MKKWMIILLICIMIITTTVGYASGGGQSEMETKGVVEKVFKYNDTDIYYYTIGNKESDAILFLHPAFSDHNIFVDQVDYFKDDYYLIFVDMIGHGNSQQDKPRVNMSDMPAIVDDIFTEEHVSSAHLVGVSMGSLIVQGVADQFPERAESVTVVGGYSIHKENDDIMKAQRKEMGKWIVKLIFSIDGLRESITEQSVYSERGKEMFSIGAEKYTRKSFMAMNGMNDILVVKSESVPYPLLLICGEYDLDLAKNAGKRLESIEPNGTYIEIKDAGHCANIDNATVFNQVLEDFILSVKEDR